MINEETVASYFEGYNDGLEHGKIARAILRAENEKLRAALHDIYEVYAGSEGFIPETCPEAYLQERVKEMADIAAKHKRAVAAALKETGGETPAS